MINKKNQLGKTPEFSGKKDAIHVAIVALVAGCPLEPGTRIKLNAENFAVNAYSKKESFGVADPYRVGIAKGSTFWALLDPEEVTSVEHTWTHKLDFSPPKVELKKNRQLLDDANRLGVTYEELITACSSYIVNEIKVPYPGMLTEEKAEESFSMYDLWSEWAEEVGHEFENNGTNCCPEYDYPEVLPFKWK